MLLDLAHLLLWGPQSSDLLQGQVLLPAGLRQVQLLVILPVQVAVQPLMPTVVAQCLPPLLQPLRMHLLQLHYLLDWPPAALELVVH